MDLQTRKLELIQAFLKIQSEEMIEKIENIIGKQKNKNNTPFPMSINEFNDRITKSLNDSKNGKLTEQNQLISMIEKWN